MFEFIDSVDCRHSSDSGTIKLTIGIEEATERGPRNFVWNFVWQNWNFVWNFDVWQKWHGRSVGEGAKDYSINEGRTYIDQHCTPHTKLNSR